MLAFIEFEGTRQTLGKKPFTVLFNYENTSFKIEKNGSFKKEVISTALEEFKKTQTNNLKQRHNVLRKLYSNRNK